MFSPPDELRAFCHANAYIYECLFDSRTQAVEYLKRDAGSPHVAEALERTRNLIAPAGAEANLKMIRDGKVGVEYQGGGALVPVEDTDLAVRAMAQ